MSPLVVGALRRLAWLLLLAALGLLLVFRVLPAFGVLGPSPEELTQAAADALETARVYGADGELPAWVAAQARLAEARRLLGSGDSWRARRAALRARDEAIEAQRAALVQREEDRRQARKAVEEIDAVLNGLEELHSAASRGADRATLSRLLSVMKQARSSGAGLLLAYEQGSYRRVLAEEQAVKTALESARKDLEAATRRR